MKIDEEKLKEEIGGRVAALREAAGKKQGPIADLLGVAVTTYRTREQGLYFFPVPELIYLADLFGVSLDYLLTGKETEGFTKEEARVARSYSQVDDRTKRIILNLLLDASSEN